MNESRHCLVLTQYRSEGEYNDFIGKFYHFPGSSKKNYLGQFANLPLEFIYYEPAKKGAGEFYGYGRIESPPFVDKQNDDFFFVEISEYKPFKKGVSFKDSAGQIIESQQSEPFYNANNSVRKINCNLLDNLCLEGKIQLNFKADAHLIKVLGEQLIGSEKVGILELIKNSIDAGATYCKIRIEQVPDLPVAGYKAKFPHLAGPVIVITDNGSGMTRKTIEDGWLRPASTIKTNVKEKLRLERIQAENNNNLGTYNSLISQLKKENKGRIPLGEKGVGRFATHRLGNQLIIRTKTNDMDFENQLKVDWRDFDVISEKMVDLDSIGVELSRHETSREYGESNSGTQIIIYGGRNGFVWDEQKIRDINKSILKLNSPNPHPSRNANKFSASLICPQIEDLETKEVHELFAPNFSFQALVNAEGVIDSYSLKFDPPSSIPLPEEEWIDTDYDLKVSDPSYWKDDNRTMRQPVCGAFYLHVDAWYRKRPWITGPDGKLMLDYLDEYGGISIYRDDIIIFPSESGSKNDWLNLSKRHIKQGFRISYYNMIGNIEIEQTENFNLIDKTDREGMIENMAFSDLAKLTETAIQTILETKFISKRDEVNSLSGDIISDPRKLSSITKENSKILNSILNNYPIADDPWSLLQNLGETKIERTEGVVNIDNSIRNLKNSIQVIESLTDRMTELAGYGIAVAVSIHEITKLTSSFYTGISKFIQNKAVDFNRLEDLKTTSHSLRNELKRLGPLRSIRNEKRKEFMVSQSIRYSSEIFKSKLGKENISFSYNTNEDFQIYGRYSALNQVISNLIDNSIYWLLSSENNSRFIKVEINSQYRTIIIADSGVGISASIRPHLFEPGYSLKIPPSGLGLYICRSYLTAMGGEIHETQERERLPNFTGAQITLEFDKVPSTKEQNS